MINDFGAALIRRIPYFLSPQMDMYKNLRDTQKLDGLKVIEIGFGNGHGTLQYAPFTTSVDAYDISLEAVRYASENVFQHNISWRTGDISSSVFRADDNYEALVCFEVLEHVSSIHQALDNLQKCLIDGGIAYISGPNKNGTYAKSNELHKREWTAQVFIKEIGSHFTSVELFDYTLTELQDSKTKRTPLIAVCTK